jgi:hypothetical protein
VNDITARLEQIEEKIENACVRSGRKRQEIRLMAVSKFHPLETVESAFKAGVRLFGESRVHEGREKFSKFWEKYPRDGSLELHLVGSLQRNKAKAAVSFFDCIQSVDRDSLIDELGALTAERESPLMVILEYHTGEETKAGFPDQDSLFRAAERLLSFPGLRPAGLMTMAPFTGDEAAIRASFRKLSRARDELEKRFPTGSKEATGYWSCLSMGMTSDFAIAIEEGSNLIRIGTAIFGEREPSTRAKGRSSPLGHEI